MEFFSVLQILLSILFRFNSFFRLVSSRPELISEVGSSALRKFPHRSPMQTIPGRRWLLVIDFLFTFISYLQILCQNSELSYYNHRTKNISSSQKCSLAMILNWPSPSPLALTPYIEQVECPLLKNTKFDYNRLN